MFYVGFTQALSEPVGNDFGSVLIDKYFEETLVAVSLYLSFTLYIFDWHKMFGPEILSCVELFDIMSDFERAKVSFAQKQNNRIFDLKVNL